jgi:hypothetical protein
MTPRVYTSVYTYTIVPDLSTNQSKLVMCEISHPFTIPYGYTVYTVRLAPVRAPSRAVDDVFPSHIDASARSNARQCLEEEKERRAKRP